MEPQRQSPARRAVLQLTDLMRDCSRIEYYGRTGSSGEDGGGGFARRAVRSPQGQVTSYAFLFGAVEIHDEGVAPSALMLVAGAVDVAMVAGRGSRVVSDHNVPRSKKIAGGNRFLYGGTKSGQQPLNGDCRRGQGFDERLFGAREVTGVVGSARRIGSMGSYGSSLEMQLSRLVSGFQLPMKGTNKGSRY